MSSIECECGITFRSNVCPGPDCAKEHPDLAEAMIDAAKIREDVEHGRDPVEAIRSLALGYDRAVDEAVALREQLRLTWRSWALTVLQAMSEHPLMLPLLPTEVAELVKANAGQPLGTCEGCGKLAPLKGWVIQAPGSPENRCNWGCDAHG